MIIGILGSGVIGKLLAKQFIKAGHSVIMSNRRGPDSLISVIAELGVGAVSGTVEEAAKQDIVLLAVPWNNVADALAGLPPWNGRILIDATNQMIHPSETNNAPRGSEAVAGLAPGANVIKAFNALFGEYMDGETPNGRRVLFFAGDDMRAKRKASNLFSDMKYSPVDVGSLANGNRLMQVGGVLSGTHFVRPQDESIDLSKVVAAQSAGGPDVLQYGVEVVGKPNKHEVKIAQKAIGVNHADLLARRGIFPPGVAQFPLVDGFDAAGIVTEVGECVTSFKVGDRVAYFLQIGAYREVRNMPADVVVPIPDDVSFDAAATLLTKGLTAKMLARELSPIEDTGNYTVLVQGAAGGVATLVVKLLKSMRVTVIGVVSSETKKETALAMGADAVLLYSEETVAEHIMDITAGKGVDAVIDGVGAATLTLSAKVLKDGGKLVSYGSHSGAITEEQAKTAAAGKAIGFAVGQVGDYVEAVRGFSNAAGEIFDLVRKGVFDNGQVRTYGFEEIPTVHALMENRQTKGVISIQV